MKISIPKQPRPVGNTTITQIPGDKSISHRAAILGSLTQQILHFDNVLFSTDCLNTIAIFRQLGVDIVTDDASKSMTITGVGLSGLRASNQLLDVGNAGTAIRLITGVLAAQSFDSRISGDSSIQKRPMKRIMDPLSQMGAKIEGINTADNVVPPLTIYGGQSLTGITYEMPVASAQVKSAILLAGLWAKGATTVIEPELCRDHTERMLKEFGVKIENVNGKITMYPPTQLHSKNNRYTIPSDISSAAFFIVLGCICPDLDLTLSNIGNNPTRNRIIKVLNEMNAGLVVDEKPNQVEPIASIRVKNSALQNGDISENDIPIIIDEIPILAVAALFGKGEFRVRNAKELRVKESDRIAAIGRLVTGIGGGWDEYDDGFIVTPASSYRSFELDSHGDHRIAMSGIIAAIGAGVEAVIHDCENINTSFPNFLDILSQLGIQATVK